MDGGATGIEASTGSARSADFVTAECAVTVRGRAFDDIEGNTTARARTDHGGYRKYLLIFLLIVYAFNSADRMALGVMLQDIKADFHLSDTQLGILTGVAFSLFYSLMGLPIARWADRGNRVRLISITAGLWGAAMMLCGAASSFIQLVLIRVCVAVGEAGCMPAALSLISDYYSRAHRARAVAIYLQAGSVSTLLGYFAAGWVNQFFGWRTTFLFLGFPGAVLALLAWFTLREPRTMAPETEPEQPAGAPTTGAPPEPESSDNLRQVLRVLWTNRTFRHLVYFYSVAVFFNVGIWQWQPAFFVRTFGLKSGELGTWITVIYAVGSILGTYLGGEFASRWAANNERLQLKAMALAYSSLTVVSGLIYLAPNRYWAFAFTALWSLVGTTIGGPLFATMQTLVPERMRATSITLVMLCANLIGLGLGPLATGGLSDLLRGWTGEDSLRYALLILCPGYMWAGWYLLQASRSVTGDLEAAEALG